MYIRYNKPNVLSLSTFDGKVIESLKPGWNEFPAAIFNLHVTNPEIVRMIETKELEIMNETQEVKGSKGKTAVKKIGLDDELVSLKDFSETKAIQYVKETYLMSILTRWSDEEVRHKVKRALEAKLKELETGEKESA